MKESHPQKVTIEMSIKTVLQGHNEELLNKREERYHHTHLLTIYLNVGNIQPFTPKYILYKTSFTHIKISYVNILILKS